MQPSRVLLLDEPCAAIDPPTRDQLLSLMRQLADAGQTLLVSSHDWGTALGSLRPGDRSGWPCAGRWSP